MLLLSDFTNIAQQNIPISTAASTQHVSIFNTLLLYSLSKKFFQNFFGPFPMAPGAPATIFEFPFSRYVSSFLFRRFDLNSHFLLQGIQPPDDY